MNTQHHVAVHGTTILAPNEYLYKNIFLAGFLFSTDDCDGGVMKRNLHLVLDYKLYIVPMLRVCVSALVYIFCHQVSSGTRNRRVGKSIMALVL